MQNQSQPADQQLARKRYEFFQRHLKPRLSRTEELWLLRFDTIEEMVASGPDPILCGTMARAGFARSIRAAILAALEDPKYHTKNIRWWAAKEDDLAVEYLANECAVEGIRFRPSAEHLSAEVDLLMRSARK